jgi:hypothetical protein
MNYIIQIILNHFTYIEYLELIQKCPYLIKYYNQKKETIFYNNKNLYQINDYLPNNLIYKENIYFFIKLLNPIYFLLDSFKIVVHKSNCIILKSCNPNYTNFFNKLQNIILNSFKKKYYEFDTCILINNQDINIHVNVNELRSIYLDCSKTKFLIKYTGAKLQNYTKMINNFELVKSF